MVFGIKSTKCKRENQNGVVAIEFALGGLMFFMMIFYWVEVSFMGFVTATVDYSVAEASRLAKSHPYRAEGKEYREVFRGIIQSTGSPWASLMDEDKFTVETSYFSSVNSLEACKDDFTATECTGDADQENKPLAVYRVSYEYQPLLGYMFFPGSGKMDISREVMVIQEYERSLFP